MGCPKGHLSPPINLLGLSQFVVGLVGQLGVREGSSPTQKDPSLGILSSSSPTETVPASGCSQPLRMVAGGTSGPKGTACGSSHV